MVKLTNILLLGFGLAATAFSLEKTSQRFAPQSKMAISKQNQLPVHSAPTFLKTTSEPAAEIVAAEAKKSSFIDLIWNENTKLTIYLAVWYLGNIYCKSILYLLIFLSDH